MNGIVYLLFLSIFLLDYLALDIGLMNHKVTWFPEILSVFVLMLVAINARHIALRPKYAILFLIFCLHILLGVVINLVPPGAIFAGLRNYFRLLPFFLLPAVYDYSETEIKNQLRFLLLLSLLQFPIVFYQKFVQFKGVLSGDVITGTLSGPGILSVYLISTIAILLSFYLRKQITIIMFFIMFFILFLPITLNETKLSLFLLPFALIVSVFYTQIGKSKIKQILLVFLLGLLFVATFITVYDHFIKPRWGHGIISFFSQEERVKLYLFKGTDKEYINQLAEQKNGLHFEGPPDVSIKYMGRLDSIRNALCFLSKDPVKLLIGLGIGNTGGSFLKSFAGEYSNVSAKLGVRLTELSRLLWEFGVMGVVIFLTFFYLIFADARYLSARQDLVGTVAAGWITVLTLLLICLFYHSLIFHNVISYLSAYLSGYIAAKHYRISWRVVSSQVNTNKPVKSSS